MCMCVLTHFSHVGVFVTPWTVVCQAPLSMDSAGKYTGVGCHAPFPGDLPGPGIKPTSPALQVDFLLLSDWGSPRRAL